MNLLIALLSFQFLSFGIDKEKGEQADQDPMEGVPFSSGNFL